MKGRAMSEEARLRGDVEDLRALVSELKAERDRLREALKKITERVISGEEANRIALAALAKEAGR